MMNAEVQNVFNQETVETAVENAISGYKAKNPDATEADVALQRARILRNIMESRVKDKFLNSKTIRTARKAHVAQAAAEHGVTFVHLRQFVPVPNKLELSEKFNRTPFLATLLEEIAELLPIFTLKERELTIAVKEEDVDGDYVKMSYSLSAQNPQDEKDSLVGKEYAIARFINGQVDVMYYPGRLRRIPLAERLKVMVEEGAVNAYRQKFKL